VSSIAGCYLRVQMMLITLGEDKLGRGRGIGHVYYGEQAEIACSRPRWAIRPSEVGDLVRQDRMTFGNDITEKIPAAHSGKSGVAPGELINVKVDVVLEMMSRAGRRKGIRQNRHRQGIEN